ncbi:hypothetical protein BB560_006924 [Smittium megazygosporum]|uniref:TFIID subunit TAF5 NTD2 domain-containing protein n=1 Tax=Smittium megazygosporum TaxID=133381 RepID=A0A2T9Y091_9FUNG|nr:hypothetical protein BB560_006924 [Smittium megazygosporum]
MEENSSQKQILADSKSKNNDNSASFPSESSSGDGSSANNPINNFDDIVLKYLRAKGYTKAEEIFAQEALPNLSPSFSFQNEAEQEYFVKKIESQFGDNSFSESGIEIKLNLKDSSASKASQDEPHQEISTEIRQPAPPSSIKYSNVFDPSKDLLNAEFDYLEQAGKNTSHLKEFFNKDDLNYNESFDTSFSKFIAWAYGSLDFYKNEFFAISYPIFIHCYLKLLELSFSERESGNVMIDVGLIGNDLNNLDKLNSENVYLGQIPIQPSVKSGIERVLKSDIARVNSMNLENKQFIDPQLLLDNFNALKQDSPSSTSIPVPPAKGYDIARQIEKLKDMSKRIAVDENNLPSICMFTLQNTHETLVSTAISENLEYMACGFSDSYIKIWNLKKEPIGKFKSSFSLVAIESEEDLDKFRNKSNDYSQLIGHYGPVYGLDFSSDSSYLISGSEDNTVRLWSTETLSNLVCFRGHNYPVWDVAFSPLGVYFASASFDKTARFWSCEHISPLRIFSGHLSDVNCVVFHPNSRYLLTGSEDKSARMWDINTGKCVRMFIGHQGPISCICVSPDGKLLASAANSPIEYSSSHASGNSQFTNSSSSKETNPKSDSNKLKAKLNHHDNVIKVWDIASGESIFTFHGHSETVTSLSFNDASSILISGSLDSTVRVWSLVNKDLSSKSSNLSTLATQSYFLEDNSDTTSSKDPENLSLTTQNSANPSSKMPTKTDANTRITESKELVRTWKTSSSPVYCTKFTTRNLAISIGAYAPHSAAI